VVNLTRPLADASAIQGETFFVNASVTCQGDPGLTCSQVRGYLRHNQLQVSGLVGDTPFYTLDSNPQTCTLAVGSSCSDSWTVYATGQVNTSWLFDVRFDSTHTRVGAEDTGDKTMTIAALPALELNYSVALPSTGTTIQNDSFLVNTTITCNGYAGLDCSMVNVTLSANSTQLTNVTSPLIIPSGTNALQNATMSAGESQSYDWTVNATGPIGTNLLMQVDVISSDSDIQSLSETHPVNISGYPTLSVTLTRPTAATNIEIGESITANATVFCSGMPSLNCSNVNATLLADNVVVSTTSGTQPLSAADNMYTLSMDTSTNQSLGWQVAGNGPAGRYELTVIANSTDSNVGKATSGVVALTVGVVVDDGGGGGSVYSAPSAPIIITPEEAEPEEEESEEAPQEVVAPLLEAAIPELLDLTETVSSEDVDVKVAGTRGETPQISDEVAEHILSTATSEVAKLAVTNVKQSVVLPTQASTRRVVDTYKLINKITKREVNQSIVTVKIYAVEDMEDVLVVESLPDVQVSASTAYFYDTPPVILQDQFIVAWKIDSIKAGEMKVFKYALAGGADEVGSDLLVSVGSKLVTDVEAVLVVETTEAIQQTTDFINSLGPEYDVSRALEQLELARAEFDAGDYAAAKRYAEEARLLIEARDIEAAGPGFNWAYVILPLLMVLLVVGYIERKRIVEYIHPTPLVPIPEVPERLRAAEEMEKHLATALQYKKEAVKHETEVEGALTSMKDELKDLSKELRHQVAEEKLRGKPPLRRGTKLSGMVLSSQLMHTLDEAEAAISDGRYDELKSIYKRATKLFNEISSAHPERAEKLLKEIKRIDSILEILLEIGHAHEALEQGDLASARAGYKKLAAMYNRLIQQRKGNEGDLNYQIMQLYQKILERSQT